MNDSSMSEIRLTQNADALKKLKRLGLLVKDQHGERFNAIFASMPIPFWVGHVKKIPTKWALGLLDDYKMPLDERCKQCKGQGATAIGICHVCKGVKWAGTNVTAPLFKIMSTSDPLIEDPSMYQAPPEKEIDAAAEALTS